MKFSRITQHDYLILKSRDYLLDQAKEIYSGADFKHTFSNKENESAVAGILGELILSEYFPHLLWVGDKMKGYDFLFNDLKFDLKTKVRNAFPPPDFFDAAVQYYDEDRPYEIKCDYFAFASTRKKMDVYAFIGVMDSFDFIEAATHRPVGTVLPGSRLPITKPDYALEYRLLHKPINFLRRENLEKIKG